MRTPSFLSKIVLIICKDYRFLTYTFPINFAGSISRFSLDFWLLEYFYCSLLILIFVIGGYFSLATLLVTWASVISIRISGFLTNFECYSIFFFFLNNCVKKTFCLNCWVFSSLLLLLFMYVISEFQICCCICINCICCCCLNRVY